MRGKVIFSVLVMVLGSIWPLHAGAQEERRRTTVRQPARTAQRPSAQRAQVRRETPARRGTTAIRRGGDGARYTGRSGTIRYAQPRAGERNRIEAPSRSGSVRLETQRRGTWRTDRDPGRTITRHHSRPGPVIGSHQWPRSHGRFVSRHIGHHGHERRWVRPWYPRWGTWFDRIPPRARFHRWHGRDYWVHRGVVYTVGPQGYLVTRPPVGFRVGWLPPTYSVYYIGGSPYYYYDNVWYRPLPGIDLSFEVDFDDDDEIEIERFEVVEPPVGGLLETLPEPYETVEVNGELYYLVGGMYFIPVYESDRIVYMRVDLGLP